MTGCILLFVALLAQDEGLLGLGDADMTVRVGESFTLDISGQLDLEHYAIQEEPPGLLFYENDDGFSTNTRFTMFFDMNVGERFYAFMQARADRGVDPNYFNRNDVRIDELFARYTLYSDEEASVFGQLGKFATPIGNWVARHDSMHNPFVRAPIVYDHVTSIADQVATPSNTALLNRRDIDDKRHVWVSMIWGPVYHAGAMLFGTFGKWDARLALTNAAPSERPPEWDRHRGEPDHFALSGRVGWNPFIGFKVGLSAAQGPYLGGRLERFGIDVKDFDQTLVGIDLEYSIGHLELWSEIYWSRWEIPSAQDGKPASVGWYVEGKYRVSVSLYGCARVGQVFAQDLDGTPWDRTTTRYEAGAGYFIYINLLAKVQYEVNHTNGPQDPRDNVLSVSMTLSF